MFHSISVPKKGESTMNELNNLETMIDTIDLSLDNVELDLDLANEDNDSLKKLWKGTKEVKLIDVYADKYGIHAVFEDKSGEIIPSYFDKDPHGSIWIGKTKQAYLDWLRTVKYTFHLSSSLNFQQIKEHMERNYLSFYFYNEGSLCSNGLIYRTRINFKESAKGV